MHNYWGTRKSSPPPPHRHLLFSPLLPRLLAPGSLEIRGLVPLSSCLSSFLTSISVCFLGSPFHITYELPPMGCNPLGVAIGTAMVTWYAILPGCSNLRQSLQAWATCTWPSFIKRPPLPQKSPQLWGGGSTSCPCSGRLGSSSNYSLYLSGASPSVCCGFRCYSLSWKHSATPSFHSLFYWFIHNTSAKCQSASLILNIQG